VWLVTVGFYVIAAIPYAVDDHLTVKGIVLSATGLLLLLLPNTRRHFHREPAAMRA
jgi:hypothetical protein